MLYTVIFFIIAVASFVFTMLGLGKKLVDWKGGAMMAATAFDCFTAELLIRL